MFVGLCVLCGMSCVVFAVRVVGIRVVCCVLCVVYGVLWDVSRLSRVEFCRLLGVVGYL